MTNMPDYETLGLLYLGKKSSDRSLLLYKNRHLTTHAAIIGMTGSGKTGLGIGIIEEAAMDQVPCLVIDPKGDMGNLLLTFPQLKSDDFAPWVDPSEATRKGMDVRTLAQSKAGDWREGLAAWHQTPERIEKLRQKAQFNLYTPGSLSGRPLSVMEDFGLPDTSLLESDDAFASLVSGSASGLLALIGEDGDPLTSRSHQLIASIIAHAWKNGNPLGYAELVAQVVEPPFATVGIFPVETFYPKRERMQLAIRLNGLMAAPSFAAWTQGDPLKIDSLLYTPEGKPCISIFNIAHLGDEERMFFVSLLLARLIAWMRRQPGSGSLKALLYMDEIFGFFPPNANPPSKEPMLLLLKQARAHGLGIVLATQNPVDLDYRGLSNIGSWFVGRLQTPQDQEKVAEGIAGSGSLLDKQAVKELLGNLKSRRFLLKSIHLDQPVLFDTRWTLSYLKGPLSTADIRRLGEQTVSKKGAEKEPAIPTGHAAGQLIGHPPIVGENLSVRYLLPFPSEQPVEMAPYLIGQATLYFRDTRHRVNIRQTHWGRASFETTSAAVLWAPPQQGTPDLATAAQNAPDGVLYQKLPASLGDRKEIAAALKAFEEHLYRNCHYPLLKVGKLKLFSEPGESHEAFMGRIIHALRQRREKEQEKLEARIESRLRRIEERLEQAQLRLGKETRDVSTSTADSLITAGAAVLSALFGRKKVSVSTISRTASTLRKVRRIGKEKLDVQKARTLIEQLEAQKETLLADLEEGSGDIEEKWSIEKFQPETFAIHPKRSDITKASLTLVWSPVQPEGR